MHLEVRFWEVLFIEEREALYLGGHKVGYRAMKGTERGVLYKKNNEEVFQFCTSFIQVGGAICECVSLKYPVPVLRLGVNDLFTGAGPYDELLDEVGLSVCEMVKKIFAFSLK